MSLQNFNSFWDKYFFDMLKVCKQLFNYEYTIFYKHQNLITCVYDIIHPDGTMFLRMLHTSVTVHQLHFRHIFLYKFFKNFYKLLCKQ